MPNQFVSYNITKHPSSFFLYFPLRSKNTTKFILSKQTETMY